MTGLDKIKRAAKQAQKEISFVNFLHGAVTTKDGIIAASEEAASRALNCGASANAAMLAAGGAAGSYTLDSSKNHRLTGTVSFDAGS